ncbi:hypothetical protein NEMBOFW57_008075 [Staphylotrichum longicolle]|uniref:Uncharacterized protein n=1 Tax=Staphylotrichum longicolle TaxID=669026 RepID=A0AAD4HWA5_9PEZI|nr:hypothetical protein NEMBOFW57_008075 [Staphylotrichum longicolle]
MDNDQFGGRTDDDLFSDDIEPVDEYATPKSAPSTASASASASDTTSAQEPAATTDLTSSDTATSSPKPPPTAPREPSSASRNNSNNNTTTTGTPATGPAAPTGNTASAVSAARLNSGANPRQKLTDSELAARMEKMRLLAAEKTRRFEAQQRDESEHAVAYAKGMEEARKRRAEEAARRKVAEEERRKLEDERAKNRERKLKAMGMKEGGWDAGKEEQEEGVGRGGFKGAYGGGRGGGRELFDTGEEYGAGRRDGGRQGGQPAAGAPPPQKKADLKKEDFPALPSSGAAPKKIDTSWVPKPGAVDLPMSPPVGKWDEEVAATMEANEAKS